MTLSTIIHFQTQHPCSIVCSLLHVLKILLKSFLHIAVFISYFCYDRDVLRHVRTVPGCRRTTTQGLTHSTNHTSTVTWGNKIINIIPELNLLYKCIPFANITLFTLCHGVCKSIIALQTDIIMEGIFYGILARPIGFFE